MDDSLSLPDAVRELNRQYGANLAHHRVWRIVVMRPDLPLFRRGRGYRIARADLPLLAGAVGLDTPVAA